MLKQFIRNEMRKINIDLIPFNSNRSHHARLKKILLYSKINILIDIGANIGEYAAYVRGLNFKGKIVCVEPSHKVFEILKSNTKKDKKILLENIGISDIEEDKVLHISKNIQSNSFLDILPEHITAAPDSEYVENEKVLVKSFEYLRHKYVRPLDKLFIKIDTQGFEWKIIKSIFVNTENICGIELEMSLKKLYKGEKLFNDIYQCFNQNGFILNTIDPVFFNEKELFQINGVFIKKDLL